MRRPQQGQRDQGLLAGGSARGRDTARWLLSTGTGGFEAGGPWDIGGQVCAVLGAPSSGWAVCPARHSSFPYKEFGREPSRGESRSPPPASSIGSHGGLGKVRVPSVKGF